MNGYVKSIEKLGRRSWLVVAFLGDGKVTIRAKSLREAREMLALAGADWIVA